MRPPLPKEAYRGIGYALLFTLMAAAIIYGGIWL
jgi:hypothetical protein